MLVLSAFFSCKKDLGNYDYTDTPVPVIDTTGIGGDIRVIRYSNLHLDPKITLPGKDTTGLTYKWMIYKRGAAATGSVITPRELANTRLLDAAIAETVGDYYVELIVTDPVTEIRKNVIFNVAVSSGMDNGWMVLYEHNGGADVDFLITPNAVPGAEVSWLKNLYSLSTGDVMRGTPRFIRQSRRTSFSSPVMNWITVGSSTEIHRMNGNDFSLMRENAAMFRRPETINPEALNTSDFSFAEVLIKGGRLHYHQVVNDLDALFGGSITGDYELAPFIANASGSSMIVAAYDQKHSRFIRPFNGAALPLMAPASAGQPFDLSNIGKDMVFMDQGFSNYTHAFFKDKTGNGRYMYTMNFLIADNGMQAMAAYNMSNLPEIANAKFYQCGELGYVAYYATEEKIYLYDYFGTNTASVAFTVPAGEKITSMKLYKPKPSFGLTTTDNRLMYLATWDGSTGRVYELAINPTSGQVTQIPLSKFEGMGKVVDMAPKSKGAGLLQ